ncbi:MAG TPA: hypothetical protein VK970_16150, partial [Candidatus Methylacidiphilales bacterium]|nr:hypothetical protein [Candidatus Methylacidiphilales bacterium]
MLWATAATHAQDLPDVPSGNGGRRPKRPGSNVKATSSQLAVPLDAELILSDDFAEMTSGWPIGESPTAVWGYNRGSYMISLRGTGRVRSENDNVVEQGIMVPKAVFRDFCLDFRATLQAQAFSYMEVRFRTSHKGFYTLAFNTKKMFSLTRFDGQYRTLLPFRKSESLQDVNDFRILVEGGRILIYANGTPIAACKDSAPLPSGGLVFLSGLASGNKLVESKLLIQKVRLYVLPLVQGEPRTEPPLITSNTPLPKQTTAPDVNSESSEGVAESPYAPPSRQNNHSAAEGQLPTSTLGETPPPAPAPATAPTPAPPSGPTIDTTPPPEVMSPQGTPTVPANPGAAATAPTIQTIPSTQDLASTAMRVDPNASGSTLPGVTSPNSAPPEPAPIPDDRARDPGTKPKTQKPAALNNIPVPGAETFPLKAGNYWIYEGIVRYDPPEGSTPLTNPNPATTGDEPAPAATAPQPGKPI